MKTKIVAKKYSLKDSRIIAAQLRELQKQAGIITPSIVVQEAESKSSPLHKYFEWRDGLAAMRYREWQARQLIASIFIVQCDQKDAEPIRAFVALQPEEEDEMFISDRGYVYTPSIAGRQSYQTQVLDYARMQLLGWRKRFGNFQQFFDVVSAIDKLK